MRVMAALRSCHPTCSAHPIHSGFGAAVAQNSGKFRLFLHELHLGTRSDTFEVVLPYTTPDSVENGGSVKYKEAS